MFSFKRKIKNEPKAEQYGRSMIEILAVLAIIAILSICGLLGYKYALKRNGASQAIDIANKYAVSLFIAKRNIEALQNSDDAVFPVFSLEDSGLITGIITIDTPEIEQIKPNAVVLTLHFHDLAVCQMAASTLGSDCLEPIKGENPTITHFFPQ